MKACLRVFTILEHSCKWHIVTVFFFQTKFICLLQNIFDNSGNRGDLCFHSPICLSTDWTVYLPMYLWMYKSPLVSPKYQRLFPNSITTGTKNRWNMEKWKKWYQRAKIPTRIKRNLILMKEETLVKMFFYLSSLSWNQLPMENKFYTTI